MEDFLFDNYKKILAIVIMITVYGAGLVLYRRGRWGAIRRVDWWKAQWKIVLFWLVATALAFIVLYLGDQFGWFGEQLK